jgi:hypothetical protein
VVKGVIDDYDELVKTLESIGHFLSRHEVRIEMSPTVTVNETFVKISVELLSTLALATKQIRQGNGGDGPVTGPAHAGRGSDSHTVDPGFPLSCPKYY